MSFVVEDGTGLATATVYWDIDSLSAYHEARGNTAWFDYPLTLQQAAAIRTMDVIEALGQGRFYGAKLLSTQALSWPRSNAYDGEGYEMTGVPSALCFALAEGALAEVVTPGCLSPNTSRRVDTERVEGAVTVQYAPGSYDGTTYKAFTRWLSRAMRGNSGNISVYRV